jgi:hypothetical protein
MRRSPTIWLPLAELGQPPLEQAPLGIVVHELERPSVGSTRLVGALEPAQ